MWAKDAGMPGSPGSIVLEVFKHAPISVVHAAVKHHFCSASFKFSQRDSVEQRDGIVVHFVPPGGVEIHEDAGRVVIPAPPKVAREGPKALLQWRNKTVERASFTDDGGNLRGRICEHADLIGAENACLNGLDHEHTLEDAPVDQRYTKEGLVGIFAGVPKILETRMILNVAH